MPSGERKKSAFVVLVRPDTGAAYMVINTSGQYGAPGGTGEETDNNAFTVACREFAEETGNSLPYAMHVSSGGVSKYVSYGPDSFYDYVMYGDCYCDCYFFYKIISPELADKLHTGPSPDPCNSEVFVGWYRPSEVWGSLRPHVREGIKMVQARSRQVATLIMPGRANKNRYGKGAAYNKSAVAYPKKQQVPNNTRVAAKSSQPCKGVTVEALEEILSTVAINCCS